SQQWSPFRGSLVPKELGLVSTRDLGRGLLEALSDPERRKRLFKRVEKHTNHKKFPDAYHFIATHIYEYIEECFQSLLTNLNAVCTSTKPPYYISIAKFKNWLCDCQKVSQDGTRAIALFACAFAVLQPAIARDLLDSLIDGDSAFGNLLLENVPNAGRV